MEMWKITRSTRFHNLAVRIFVQRKQGSHVRAALYLGGDFGVPKKTKLAESLGEALASWLVMGPFQEKLSLHAAGLGTQSSPNCYFLQKCVPPMQYVWYATSEGSSKDVDC
eukprot:1144578-Pelagomonas_calceolata.AAC.5